jgi:hypothetical protein
VSCRAGERQRTWLQRTKGRQLSDPKEVRQPPLLSFNSKAGGTYGCYVGAPSLSEWFQDVNGAARGERRGGELEEMRAEEGKVREAERTWEWG